MIIDTLIEYALSKAEQLKLKDVRAGLGYTCVMLEDNSCGLAYTFRDELGECCSILSDAGGLIGKTAADIIPWAKNRNRLKAALGLAAINAVINTAQTEWDTGNVTTALDVRPYSTVGMIGEFRPILNEVKKKTDSIYVFEQNVTGDSTLYSSDTIPQYLPKCDVVVVTATSLINQTIDGVLSNCGNARQVCMLGPSTPLCPDVFREYNVHLLAGTVVTNPQRILEIVSQGGGTMSMKPAIRQVLVKT